MSSVTRLLLFKLVSISLYGVCRRQSEMFSLLLHWREHMVSPTMVQMFMTVLQIESGGVEGFREDNRMLFRCLRHCCPTHPPSNSNLAMLQNGVQCIDGTVTFYFSLSGG